VTLREKVFEKRVLRTSGRKRDGYRTVIRVIKLRRMNWTRRVTGIERSEIHVGIWWERQKKWATDRWDDYI
jgi:hypothetical protein